MLKAAIFDWGGVLMRTVDAGGRRKWEKKLGLPLYAVDRVVHGSRSWKQAQSGTISDAEYWADVAAQLALDDETLSEFRRDYFGGDRLDQEMVEIRGEMIKAGEAERDRIVAQAEEKAARIRKDTTFLIEQQIKQLRKDLTQQAANAAVVAAQELLQERTTDADQDQLAETYLNRLDEVLEERQS